MGVPSAKLRDSLEIVVSELREVTSRQDMEELLSVGAMAVLEVCLQSVQRVLDQEVP